MGFHYTFNASGAHRWEECHAFKTLAKSAPPRPVGLAAITGTAAHFLAEWAMTSGYSTQIDDKLIGGCIRINVEGDAVAIVTGPGAEIGASYSGIMWAEDATQTSKVFPHVIRIDEKMVKAVSAYLAIVDGILAKYNHTARRHVEVGFQLAADMGGMGDIVIQTKNRLIVMDYKNGYHPVDAENNAQLAMYGVGALTKFAFDASTIEDVVMGIVQPNADGPTLKTWTQTREQLLIWRDRFEKARYKCLQVEQAHAAGADIKEHCNAGSWCKWCRAMVNCPLMQDQTETLSNLPVFDVTSVDDKRLMWIAHHGDNMIEFINTCRDHMTNLAVKKGRQWPGFKVVESVTKRKLIDKDALTKALKDGGQSNAFEPKLKALSKLEKIFGKEEMAPFIMKPKGALVMVPDTDGRPIHNEATLANIPALENK